MIPARVPDKTFLGGMSWSVIYEENIFGKIVQIPCPEMAQAEIPESEFSNYCWIFCQEMTLAQFREIGFFVQNSRIGVKGSSDRFFFENNIGKSRIRHATTLKLNLQIESKPIEDDDIKIQNRSMSDPTLSGIEFKNKMNQA